MLLKYSFLSKIICIHWLNEGATVCGNCCGKNLKKPPYVTIIVNPVLCPCVDKYVSFSYSKQHLCSIGPIILGLGWCGPAGRSLGRRCSRRCGFIGRWRLHHPKQRAKTFIKWITYYKTQRQNVLSRLLSCGAAVTEVDMKEFIIHWTPIMWLIIQSYVNTACSSRTIVRKDIFTAVVLLSNGL